MKYLSACFLILSALCAREIPVDDYHGVLVEDRYRHFEDLNSEETKEWIEQQNQRTSDYLSQIPQRSAIRQRLDDLADYERYGYFFQRGRRYFYFKNDGLQNQNILYTKEALDAPAEVLIDPNLFSKDGTIALNHCSVSSDARFIAYATSHAGSDWNEIRVRDIQTKQDLKDAVEWVKFSYISWAKDGSGFYYSRYDKPVDGNKLANVNMGHKIYFHALGTDQEKDVLIFERPDRPDWLMQAFVSDDGDYLMIFAHCGCEVNNALFYKDLRSGGPILGLQTKEDAQYIYLGNEGTKFWLMTTKDAPSRRIIALDLNNPGDWQEIVAQQPQALSHAVIVGRTIIAHYLQDAHSQVKLFNLNGGFEKELQLPSLGTAMGFPGYISDRETFYIFSSYTQPPTVFRYDFNTGKSEEIFRPSFSISCDDYETKQVFYMSKDGTEIPMFISHKKGLVLDGSSPTILYGYGGFGISITPSFSVIPMAWMEMGGVYAVAGIRGGGEYGELWHEAGKIKNKQTVFDDFIAAAQWLIASNITSSPKLAISGASNGGLLVGACLTQRPDLFGAAIPGVGVFDMLRFHKFTIGWAWTAEYGSPDNPEEFPYLLKYSPLHNIKQGVSYPPTLITTADHDDRVVPLHSYKFAAALQEAGAPALIRVETSAGHGAGNALSKFLDESADKLSFLIKNLEVQK